MKRWLLAFLLVGSTLAWSQMGGSPKNPGGMGGGKMGGGSGMGSGSGNMGPGSMDSGNMGSGNMGSGPRSGMDPLVLSAVIRWKSTAWSWPRSALAASSGK